MKRQLRLGPFITLGVRVAKPTAPPAPKCKAVLSAGARIHIAQNTRPNFGCAK